MPGVEPHDNVRPHGGYDGEARGPAPYGGLYHRGSEMGQLGVFLGLFWGAVWAAFLEWIPFGRFLVKRRTWITVVVGVGGDLAIALGTVDFEAWQQVTLIVAASALPIILRSLLHESGETASVRLPNKVIWGVEDILARCLRMRDALERLTERARVLEDSALLSELVTLEIELSSIRARAVDARRGTYDYSLEPSENDKDRAF